LKTKYLHAIVLSGLLSLPLSASAEPAKSSLQLCEEKTKAFLKTDYVSDPKIPKTFFTPEFAALWLKACNPPEGETIYWGADPILETQDTDPKLLSLGPAEILQENILVPVSYKHQGLPPFTKTFAFVQQKGRWVIADIFTTGTINPSTGKANGRESEFQKLSEDFGAPSQESERHSLDKDPQILIGKWEIRTYGYHFKADGTMELFNPDDGSKLSSGTWSLKGNQLRIKTDEQEQIIKIKIISQDAWEWIVTPDRTWEATRIK
jgi:hypothetical protein